MCRRRGTESKREGQYFPMIEKKKREEERDI